MAHLIIVVEAAVAPVARGHALSIDPAGGGAAFDVGLSPTGKLPATHYWVGWEAPAGTERLIRRRFAPLVNSGRAQIYAQETTGPYEVLAALKLRRVIVPLPVGPGEP